MKLTKMDLIDSISKITDSEKEATKIVETLLKMIKQSLENGEDILLTGFGKFCVKDKNKRRGRNPFTGEELMLDARRVVTFRPSVVLMRSLNEERNKL
jgi:integration host factor subunit alpha